ncbi:NnrU protein (plasmid) [Caballeronia sp. SBC1]|uniref:NnrU family protein n=1 Tax=unclassified Caballeronia TaxID=2646786 RepID=UPI0013E175FD|nr:MULTISPECIES: NnrU family protein [unclassified Caballeronia]QIE26527.1 NnrU protein [Caballeronia sp. SBC2]QIN64157.1 NnrU protein [Caballeronia sp. SBC1]
MTIFVAGLLIFLGIHSVSIVAPRWRDAQAARMGEKGWKGLYALVSIASFVAMIYGYGIARQAPVMVYAPPMALRHLALLLMLPVFPLLIAAYLPGRIKRLTRNPMLLAVILWAVSHLLANGTLNDLLLFGGFLVWSVADLISVSRRAHVRPVPGAPASAVNDVIVIVVGLGLYAFVLLSAHTHVIGVSPLG